MLTKRSKNVHMYSYNFRVKLMQFDEHYSSDTQLSDLTRMFVIKDSWIQSRDRRKKRMDNTVKFLSQRVLVIAAISGLAAIVHTQSDNYSMFVYALGCTLYILVKK